MTCSILYVLRINLQLAGLLPLLFLVACTGVGDSSPGAGISGAKRSASGNSVIAGARDGNIRVVSRLPVPANQKAGGEIAITKGDLLEIDVFQVNDLDRTVEVDATGVIQLPLIGRVQAGGKTVRQLEAELRNRYGRNYLQSPQISVFIKESNSRRLTVDGEVRKAGIQKILGPTTLTNAIAQAGGLSEIADAGKVYVFRSVGTERLVANFSVAAIRQGRQGDPQVFAGDTVVVFKSSTKVAMKNLREALGVASSARVFIP